MHIKIINPAKDGNKVYDNTEGPHALIAYLKHEEKEGGNRLYFFDQWRQDIAATEGLAIIDGNVRGLRREQVKFFSIVVSPSEEELRHISNADHQMQKYVREVMKNYAENFNFDHGKNKGRRLTYEEVVWIAAIHEDRTIRSLDLQQEAPLSKKEQEAIKSDGNQKNSIMRRAIQRNERKLDPDTFGLGERKPGLNKHVHIIVSARDRSQTIALDPTGLKRRFAIKTFQEKSALAFESMFGYQRATLSKRFYEKYSRGQHEYYGEKISAVAERINQKQGSVEVDPKRLREIGRKYDYSRVFFINLGRLKNRYVQGEKVPDAYFFLEKGRDKRPKEYFQELSEQYSMASKRSLGNERTHMRELTGVLQAARSPVAIKETLLFDQERKILDKYRQKGKGGDNIEVS